MLSNSLSHSSPHNIGVSGSSITRIGSLKSHHSVHAEKLEGATGGLTEAAWTQAVETTLEPMLL